MLILTPRHLSEKLRKERDFHKMHHSRVQQEKKTVTNELEKLKTMTRTFDEKYTELSQKYETLMKDKMVLKLERDRLQAKCDSLQKSLNSVCSNFLLDRISLKKSSSART
jgi:sperm-associated antigen 16 protein